VTGIAFTLNGTPISSDVQPRTHLGDFLRDRQRLSGTHLGCEHGVCGACTVQINGAPARSCLTLAVACGGVEVTTIEGFDQDPVMADLREAFTAHHALQCGFCTPGMLITARDIVLRLPYVDEQTIRKELSGNLCRCTGYVGIVNAIASVIEKRKQRTEAPAEIVSQPAAAFTTFEPVTASAISNRPASSTNTHTTTDDSSLRPGWTRFNETFIIEKPRAVVWELFDDVRRVASCLPGVEVTSCDDASVKGRMTTKLGPISASFAGSAMITRDPANWRGTIVGAGSDGGSGSRTRGEIAYQLEPTDQDTATRVDISVDYNLQGPLAQFSRSSLAQEFARQLVTRFAANCRTQLGGNPPIASASGSLQVGNLFWLALRARINQIFGRSQ
jgi:carbon-monoxide dehydrogenase small subunit